MHKGDSGRIVVLGGATGTTGAAIMCASAALRSGAGLVTIACPSSATQAVHASLPQAMAYDWTLPLGDIFGAADVIVCGPGMGTSAVATEALEEALDTAAIVVLDADALNLVAADPDAWSLAERDAPTVLTPHPGEAARLLGDSASDLLDDSYSSARRLATTFGACSVFKSSCATVAAADGRLAVNASGNPGMATGGMGDALAGIVAARLCDEPDPFEALCEAVFAHGMAGDIAAERVGERALSVADLIDALPTVWLLWEER
jgi:NAD(P)H-hydrate epimerase